MKEKELQNVLVKHRAGSHAYGTNIETSDEDFRGIFCGEEVNIRTPFFNIKECKIEDEEDTSFYELANYCKLAAENNPNVLESLWVDWADVTYTTPAYGKLREERGLFTSSKLAHTTTGYAMQQLKRLNSRKKHAVFFPEMNLLCDKIAHAVENEGGIEKKWILRFCGKRFFDYFCEKFGVDDDFWDYETWETQETLNEFIERVGLNIPYESLNTITKPKQTDFMKMIQYFGEEKMLKFDVYNWKQGYQLVPYGNNIFGLYDRPKKRIFNDTFEIIQFFNEDRALFDDFPVMIVKYNEKQYKEALHAHKKFWEWYKNRNTIRLEMEKDCGFDRKHAMHLVRLMRIGEEVLTTGKYNVKRKDAEELLAIREGAWSYGQLIKYAEEKDALIRGDLYKNTKLPRSANIKAIAELLMEIQNMIWKK